MTSRTKRLIQPSLPELLCFSHLPWDLVWKRPQHLMTRFARHCRTFFFEEPVEDVRIPKLTATAGREGVNVVVPHLPAGISPTERRRVLSGLLDELCRRERIVRPIRWYSTPMALPWSHQVEAAAVVYDCMDELTAVRGAPPELDEREQELFEQADLVFTGGQTLYEAKRTQHGNVHAFPPAVEVEHFTRARTHADEPADQAALPRPRIGYAGVVDERMDYELLDALARARRDWHFVMIGPVVRVDQATLPRGPNLHWLGRKEYARLPHYMATWDAAVVPFAHDVATRFISPSKTPEYLAAGCPVVSTSIRDVVRPYGQRGLVRIADTVPDFVAALEASLAEKRVRRLEAVDSFLSRTSWDRTFERMLRLVEGAVRARTGIGDELAAEIGSSL
jgi:UDP-galactopyranose mutase